MQSNLEPPSSVYVLCLQTSLINSWPWLPCPCHKDIEMTGVSLGAAVHLTPSLLIHASIYYSKADLLTALHQKTTNLLKNIFSSPTERDFTPGKKITKCLISFTAISQINTRFSNFIMTHVRLSAASWRTVPNHKQLISRNAEHITGKICAWWLGCMSSILSVLQLQLGLLLIKKVFGIFGATDCNQASFTRSPLILSSREIFKSLTRRHKMWWVDKKGCQSG